MKNIEKLDINKNCTNENINNSNYEIIKIFYNPDVYKLNQLNKVCEESEGYNENNKVNKLDNAHDKSIRMVLLNKNEAIELINKALKLQGTAYEIKPNDIELCNTRFLSKTYFDSESDIIYKLKNKKVIFIIEHQSKVDYMMPVRVAMYSTEAMRRILKETKNKNKEFKISKIIPIVVYTGDRKWTANTDIKEMEEKFGGENIENLGFGEYIIYEGNSFTDKELLEQPGVLSKIILLERCKSQEELIEKYNKINEIDLNKEEKELLDDYTTNVTRRKISEKELEEIRKKYINNDGGKSMLAEMLDREYEKKYQLGKSEGIKVGKSEGIKVGKSEGIKFGKSEGIKFGKSEGVKFGKSQTMKRIIKTMKKNGLTEKDISRLTNTPLNEVQSFLT